MVAVGREATRPVFCATRASARTSYSRMCQPWSMAMPGHEPSAFESVCHGCHGSWLQYAVQGSGL
eukprot:37236-Prymnesium_polylepis.1